MKLTCDYEHLHVLFIKAYFQLILVAFRQWLKMAVVGDLGFFWEILIFIYCNKYLPNAKIYLINSSIHEETTSVQSTTMSFFKKGKWYKLMMPNSKNRSVRVEGHKHGRERCVYWLICSCQHLHLFLFMTSSLTRGRWKRKGKNRMDKHCFLVRNIVECENCPTAKTIRKIPGNSQ